MKLPVLMLAALLTILPGKMCRADAIAMNAINALGIDVLHQTASIKSNALMSPYSIQRAMAMVCAGTDGETRDEMVRVLHYPADQQQLNNSFAELQTQLDAIMERSISRAAVMKRYGLTNDLLTLTTADRLFGQQGYDFRPTFLTLLKDTYQAPFEPMDFRHDAPGATEHINAWVEDQTHQRIQHLIPPGLLDQTTRLVLVNAIYLKAPWQSKFEERNTQPRAFNLSPGSAIQIPTMFAKRSLGYARQADYTVVTVPYGDGDLQFVILLPNATNGLAALEVQLTPKILADCANLPNQEIELFLPKFKLEPAMVRLSDAFKALGLKTAFDLPPGSANFDRMAPRRVNDYLYISEVLHKAFLKLDEGGTEAAAATAVVMAMGGAMNMAPVAPPVQVRVDHPFLFAIQHRASGACLFLGHVVDPR